jgi:hypothetical protein
MGIVVAHNRLLLVLKMVPDKEQLDLMARVISAFNPDNAVQLKDLDADSDMAKKGRAVSDFFTSAVQGIMALPDPHLSILGKNIWDVFHYEYVRIAMGPKVPSLSMAIVPAAMLNKLGFSDVSVGHHGVVIAPHDWLDQIKKDPLMQFGAVLFVGSQAVDYYNKRYTVDPQNIQTRAQAFESRFLRLLPENELNEYQKSLVKQYQGELDPDLLYDRKPVQPLN